ncbi:MAG: sialate O-acetylesterase [Cyclobacteriaceae bacterium]
MKLPFNTSLKRTHKLYSMIWALLLFITFSCGQTGAGDDPLDIVLCIGQSNMAGRGDIEDQDTVTLEDVLLFNAEQEFEPAKNPMNKYSTVRKNMGMQRLSPAWTFGINYQAAKGGKVGLVVNARGGSKIMEWQKGTLYYNEAIIRALQAQKHGTITGIIWHQGEGDRNQSELYQDRFDQMISDMRKDLGIPNLPVVVGEVGNWRGNSGPINEVIRNLERNVPYVKAISAEGLNHLGDSTHFDSDAQRKLGKAYAEALIELQENAD